MTPSSPQFRQKFYRPLFQFLSGRLGEDRVLAPKKTATSTQQQQQQRQQQQKQQQRSSSSVVSALHNSAHYRGDRSKFGALDQQLRLQVIRLRWDVCSVVGVSFVHFFFSGKPAVFVVNVMLLTAHQANQPTNRSIFF